MKSSLLLALGSAALTLTALGVTAQAQLMRGHDSNAPVNFSADRIEVQDRADRVLVSGNVHVTQADLTLDSTRMTVAYRNAGGIQIDRIDAAGNVRIVRQGDTARGDVAIYDLNAKIITLLGNVELMQQGNRLTGGRLTMDLNTGRSTVDGRAAAGAGGTTTSSGGRVSGTFTVPQRESK
ncbi:LptA/OstA family protein [Sphingobium subterraneum]|uniref:Lipopolysaccharide export system protein LptA n=1 Tax=Sphingobium subterraneum TaxID=627688 RepID=A0A841J2L0_9SPHN|nr:LptA/OstA family protein [Sphingobium subterraneum]MBB6124954.1 lipopolysaccharide export system protein LptA [Sphingobium subterraneum]